MPIHTPGARPAAAAVALLCVLSVGARAAPRPSPQSPPPIALQVVGSCPAEAVVAASLRRLLPRHQVMLAADDAARSLLVRIEDMGPSYRVTVTGRTQEFQDAQRDCAERAHSLAVLVTMAADPPRLAASPPPAEPVADVAPVPPSPAASSVTPQFAAPRLRIGVMAGLYSDVAPERVRFSTGGVSLRAELHRGRFGASVGVAGLWPSEAVVAGVPVHLLQVPFDAGFRVQLVRRGRIALWGEIGASVVVVLASATGIHQPGGDVGPDFGVRTALELQGDVATGWWLFLALHARITPAPAWFDVPPKGELGSMPHVWFGLSAGVGRSVR